MQNERKLYNTKSYFYSKKQNRFTMRHTFKLSVAIIFLLMIAQIMSCKKEDADTEVISSFTYSIDTADFMKANFKSYSNYFETLSWDFGDNSATSTEAAPSHVYATLGVYTVVLTATASDGTFDAYAQTVTISDPNAELTKLVGEVSKTWKLLRDVSTGDYPLEVGPIDHSMIWWAVGLNNNELAGRPCMMNDEWTFYRDGTLQFDAKGDFWREGGIFPSANVCGSTDDMVNSKGEDCGAWGSGTHQFELVNGINPKLKALGKGAFIGFFKSATDIEVPKLDPMVQDSVIYDVVKLTEGTTDTLIVQANYKFEVGDPNPSGYWRYVLVHYDNPDDEPPLPTE